jgi:hypothetical protein
MHSKRSMSCSKASHLVTVTHNAGKKLVTRGLASAAAACLSALSHTLCSCFNQRNVPIIWFFLDPADDPGLNIVCVTVNAVTELAMEVYGSKK